MTRSGYRKLEIQEESGRITLATLAKAAEALACELVYGLRPKHLQGFAMAGMIERKVSTSGFQQIQRWAKG